MLQRNLNNLQSPPSWWQDLDHGAPTLVGFARLCSESITQPDARSNDQLLLELSPESQAILALARHRGTFEIKASRDGFDSAERFLAVHVEVELDRWRRLLDKSQPEQTVGFLEGFRGLCQAGLILHHMQNEFSLSARGFDVMKLIDAEPLESLMDFGMELDV